MEMAAKRPQFTSHEEILLVTEVEKRRGVLEGKLTPSLTNKMKKEAWQEVSTIFNAYDEYYYFLTFICSH